MSCLKNIVLILLSMMSEILMAQEAQTKQFKSELIATVPAPSAGGIQLGLAGPVTGVHNDVLFVGGGANFPGAMPWLGGKKKYYDDLYVFKREKDGAVVSSKQIFELPYPTAYGANCSTPEGLVYAGGEDENGLSQRVLLVQWDQQAAKIDVNELPGLPFAVANASAAYYGRKVYLAGGETADAVSSAFFQLDLDAPLKVWKRLPDLPKQLSHSVLVAYDGGLYLIGGRKRNPGGLSSLSASVYFFDCKSAGWSEKASLPYVLSAGTGVATSRDGILLFGGDRGETFHRTEALIAAIATEKLQTKKDELNEEKIRLQSAHPGFSRDILRYDSRQNAWSVAGTIPFEVPVTTSAVEWGNAVILPSGEIKAGVRSPGILGIKPEK